MSSSLLALNLMRRTPATCAPWDTVGEALRIARQEQAGVVLVVSCRVHGFMSVDDLLRSPAVGPVRDVMSPIACVPWDATAEQVRRALARSPVVAVTSRTSNHAVFGIITASDAERGEAAHPEAAF